MSTLQSADVDLGTCFDVCKISELPLLISKPSTMTQCPNHLPSQVQQDTGIELLQDKMVSCIYANISRNVMNRLSHAQSKDSEDQVIF